MVPALLEEAVAHFRYDSETGDVFRVKQRGPAVRIIAKDRKGYVRTKFKGKQILAHRLAWRLHYGAWPPRHLDHANGDRADNRIANLRLVDFAQNQQNRHHRTGVSPFKGVTLHKGTGKWQAQIKKNGRSIYLGLFDSDAMAARAYDEAARRLFGPFCNTNQEPTA